MKLNLQSVFLAAIASIPAISAMPAIAEYFPHFSPTNDENAWVLVGTSENGSRTFLDVVSVQQNKHIAFFWQQTFFTDPQIAYNSAIFFNSANCNTREVRQRYVVAFDEDMNKIGTEADGDQGLLMRGDRGTLLGDLVDAVCR